MRPEADDDRELVIPPGRSYTEKLDPRLFCFGVRSAHALVPGAKVTPLLVAIDAAAPVVAPIDGIQPVVASLATLTGDEITLGAPPAPPPTPAEGHGLAVTSSHFEDAERGPDAEITITVANTTPRRVTLLFRPETVALDVTGPSGVGVTDPSPTTHCSLDRVTHPIPEVLTTLAPKQHASLAVMLAALCPEGTFDTPGLYTVRAKLDTRQVSGNGLAVRLFEGEAIAESVAEVRVRTRTGPAAPRPRPHLASATE
jgi:hypothetical protein